MLKFANAKINLGLHIRRKRPDGYHDLETIFYPVKLYDVVEITPHDTLEMRISNSDLSADHQNLCIKAFKLLEKDHPVKPVSIHLLKNIPIGAGLGGGSSDASATLQLLNNFFQLDINDEQLKAYAARLGADCPFFIENKPMYAQGTGTELTDIQVNLKDYLIIIIKPDIHISTAEAYSNVSPMIPKIDLREAIKLPIQEWKYQIKNDFEISLFEKYPLIADIKAKLYEKGAMYASMSGSGSSVFGIFEKKPEIEDLNKYGKVYFPVEL